MLIQTLLMFIDYFNAHNSSEIELVVYILREVLVGELAHEVILLDSLRL